MTAWSTPNLWGSFPRAATVRGKGAQVSDRCHGPFVLDVDGCWGLGAEMLEGR